MRSFARKHPVVSVASGIVTLVVGFFGFALAMARVEETLEQRKRDKRAEKERQQPMGGVLPASHHREHAVIEHDHRARQQPQMRAAARPSTVG